MGQITHSDIKEAFERATAAGLEDFMFQDPSVIEEVKGGPLSSRRRRSRRSSRRRSSRRTTRRSSRRSTGRCTTRRSSRCSTSRRRTSRRRTSRRRTSRRFFQISARRRTSRNRFVTEKRFWRNGNMWELRLTK